MYILQKPFSSTFKRHWRLHYVSTPFNLLHLQRSWSTHF